MDNICVLLTLFLILPTIAEAKCIYKNGVNRFGDKCGFMCHCKDNIECDVDSGECSSGCARGWYGPGCQYRDILENKLSKFSDTNYSLSVTDGDSKTCLRQVKSSSIKHQSWSVRLDSNETINEIQIGTTAKSLAYFKNFEVFVGYIPSAGNDVVVYEQTCFRQRDGIQKSRTFTVLCDKPFVGNYVRIEFTESQNELELCDVKINGGRNLAFNRSASQVSKAKSCGSMYCKAEASLDGQTNTTIKWFCSYTRKMIKPWWKVDIGFQIQIWSVQILSYIGKQHDKVPYVVHITNSTNSGTESIYSTQELLTDTQTIALNSMGKFVKISIDLEVKHKLAVCEVFVFGDCPANRCGYNCEKQCQCEHAPVWNKITGNCSIRCNKKDKGYLCDMPSKTDNDYSLACGDNCLGDECDSNSGKCIRGCKSGWGGTFCNQTCNGGYYGQNCFKKCSDHCKHGNKYCNKVDGNCTYGCMDGWKVPLCDQECSVRKYGAECKEDCASTCKHGLCDHVSGDCHDGCKRGYQGNTCERKCGPGTFGENCEEKCSSTCKNGVCSHLYGGCSNGCKPGYHGNKCEQKCNDGYYGDKCANQCNTNCKEGDTICRHTDGECLNGCQAGWNGNRCDSTCSPGKFGIGCKESCPSNCKHDVCGYVNGDCVEGCKLGFQGKKCKENCTSGTFGDDCGGKCSDYCVGGDKMCRPRDGHCLNGCQAGWNGTSCFSACDIGFYGNNCALVCGNCKLGNSCNHVTGICYGGCKPGYSGDTCLQVSDNILSDTKPYTGCNETQKLKIALTCVGILCAIIVVYATVITILCKRKTTHNIKDGSNVSCCGRSCDDATANKTETVTAEAATEAASELARVNINASDDESHQYTDLTPDTKDVEATYETIQLE